MRIRYKSIIILTLFFLTFFSSTNFADDVFVDSNLTISDNFSINSSAGILVDIDYCKILYEKNSKNSVYPASTTKIMTAILTCENCNLKDKVTVSYWAVHSVPDSYITGNVLPGEVYTIEEILNITMIASSNDAAFVLAEYIANLGNPNYLKDDSEEALRCFNESINKFASMMNSKAKEIGCTNTNFVNPNGIHDDNHYSTAYDLALMGIYAYKNPIILNIASKRSYSLNKNSRQIEIKSTNPLLREDSEHFYPYANGLKTGYTNPAGSCIIATAKKDNMNLLIVTLNAQKFDDGTSSRENDCINLFNYGFENYFSTKLINEGDIVRTFDVTNATENSKTLDLICKNTLDCLTEKGKIIDATPEIVLDDITAPIAKGQVVGSITYNIDGIKYSSDLIASHNVYSASITNIILILLISFIVLLIPVIILSIKSKNSGKH